MQQTRAVEFGTGLFVILGFCALFYLTTQTSNIGSYQQDDYYELTARFDNVGGLQVRAPVTVAGVRVGRVSDIEFDPERLEAVVTLQIASRFDRLPNDSDASILTSGLIGAQYIGIGAGGMDEYFQNGDEFEFTQGALILENLIGKFLVNAGKSDE
ncbi:MAG: outer membrane lipid asymmetry maintenance protein MlaD [Pseudomonadota bacterium]